MKDNARYRLALPVVSHDEAKKTAVLVTDNKDPDFVFFEGVGDTDLLCSNCGRAVCRGLGAGQVQHMAFRCPGCESYVYVHDIPRLRDFVAEIRKRKKTSEQLPKLQRIISEAVEQKHRPEQVAQTISEQAPELAWAKKYLVPTNAEEFYSLLTLILTVVLFFMARKTEPSTVVHNHYYASGPKREHRNRKSPCECGSGKEYRLCHGKKPK